MAPASPHRRERELACASANLRFAVSPLALCAGLSSARLRSVFRSSTKENALVSAFSSKGPLRREATGHAAAVPFRKLLLLEGLWLSGSRSSLPQARR